MKKIMTLAAGAAALTLISGCAAIGADRNQDGTYRPNAKLPDGNSNNRVDSLKPQAPTNEGPSYTRPEAVRPEDRSDELLGGPDA